MVEKRFYQWTNKTSRATHLIETDTIERSYPKGFEPDEWTLSITITDPRLPDPKYVRRA